MICIVNILGFEILKSGIVNKLEKKITALEDDKLSNRPTLDFLNSLGTGIIKIPRLDVPYKDMEDLVRYSDILRNIIGALKSEIFRNEFDIEPAFTKKCPNSECEQEYNYDIDECDSCGTFLTAPSQKEKDLFEKFEKRANFNGQTLIDVFKEVEEDLDIGDNGYILINMDYTTTKEGQIVGKKLIEILRVDPSIIRMVADKFGKRGWTDDGKRALVCIDHRNDLVFDKEICSKCGKLLYPVHFAAQYQTGQFALPTYYIKGEIIHSAKFKPTLLYGQAPPILTVWQKAIALLDMDKFIKTAYGLQRPPKGMLLVSAANKDSVKKSWEHLQELTKNNPHAVHPFAIENPNGTKGKFAEWISFMPELTNMQFTEIMKDMRTSIGAVYGVMPVFHGDLSTSGGLNQEGLQITVTTRAIDSGQVPYNTKFIPAILEALQITHWDVTLAKSEEKDEMAELQRDTQEIQNAVMMRNMGFNVELDEQGNFKFSGEASEPIDTELPFGSFSEPNIGAQGSPPSPKIKKKVKKGTIRESTEYRKGLEKELKLLIRKLNFKRNTKQSLLIEKINSLIDFFTKRMKKKSDIELGTVYEDTVEKIEKKLNVNIVGTEHGNFVLNTVKNSNIYRKAFKGLNNQMTKRVNEVIATAYKNPKGFTISGLIKDMADVVELSDSRLENIARTETHNISTLATEQVFKEFGPEFKVKWINPIDHRTTDICKKIVSRTKNGVTVEALKEIIRQESDKTIYTESRPFVPHLQCRSVMASN